jgi:hypothetical protein
MHLNPEWVAALAALAGLLGAFALWLARLLWHTLQRTIHLLDDYFGRPADGDVPARPGVMARLGALEGLVQEIRAETQPNGGSSLRDVVHRIAADVADVKDEQARLKTQIELRNPTERN